MLPIVGHTSSRSPSPQTNIDSVMDQVNDLNLFNESISTSTSTSTSIQQSPNGSTIIGQLGQPLSNNKKSKSSKSKSKLKSKSKSKSKSKQNNLKLPNDADALDSNDESLHEMVQSILNDSDNDVVLNNLNGLGYDKIPYNSIISKNENTASQIYRHPQINNPSPRNQGNDPKLFPPIDV